MMHVCGRFVPVWRSRLRAERKAGAMLATRDLNGGDRRSESHGERVNLVDLGVNRNQSSRWQRSHRAEELGLIGNQPRIAMRGCRFGRPMTREGDVHTGGDAYSRPAYWSVRPGCLS
jgi:hypothetical protein